MWHEGRDKEGQQDDVLFFPFSLHPLFSMVGKGKHYKYTLHHLFRMFEFTDRNKNASSSRLVRCEHIALFSLGAPWLDDSMHRARVGRSVSINSRALSLLSWSLRTGSHLELCGSFAAILTPNWVEMRARVAASNESQEKVTNEVKQESFKLMIRRRITVISSAFDSLHRLQFHDKPQSTHKRFMRR